MKYKIFEYINDGGTKVFEIKERFLWFFWRPIVRTRLFNGRTYYIFYDLITAQRYSGYLQKSNEYLLRT